MERSEYHKSVLIGGIAGLTAAYIDGFFGFILVCAVIIAGQYMMKVK